MLKKFIVRQAIETKYIGPTDKTGARIKATCAGGSVTISRWDRDSIDAAHILAVQTLCQKLNWQFDHVCGITKNGNYVWVENNNNE